MKKRTIKIHGYDVHIFDFGYGQYMYPDFNGNAEFKVNHEGFRKLSHYLRTLIWAKQTTNQIIKDIDYQILN